MYSCNVLSHVRLSTEFGFVIGFIEHLQIITTSNNSAIANSHTLQFTTAGTNSSQFAVSSPIVAWRRIPTMSSVSGLTFLPVGDYLTTNSLLQVTVPLLLLNCIPCLVLVQVSGDKE
jgi:hypothetical protein